MFPEEKREICAFVGSAQGGYSLGFGQRARNGLAALDALFDEMEQRSFVRERGMNLEPLT